MENALVQFGTTIALGGFVIIVIYLFGRLLQLWGIKQSPGLWNVKKSGEDKNILAAFAVPSFFIISFFVGVILEDLSDPFFNKFQVLYSTENRKVLRNKVFEESFYLQYAHRGIIKKISGEGLDDFLESHCFDGREIREINEACKKAIYKTVEGNFHYSKNRAYKEETYYQELSKIEDRINLSRSLMFAFCFLPIIFVTLFFYACHKNPSTKADENYLLKSGLYLVIFFALSILSIFFTSKIFEAEHRASIKRIFGYGISLFDVGNQNKWGAQIKDLPMDVAPEIAYRFAMDDAIVAEKHEISKELWPIKETNGNLRWGDNKTKLLVVTLKSRENFKKYIKDNKATKNSEEHVVWVTLAPQLQDFCSKYLSQSDKKSNDELLLRVKQYLGLSISAEYDVVVEMWVSPDDIFRPCVDPAVDDNRCELQFDRGAKFKHKNIENYPAFYKNIYFKNFRSKGGVPWTGLGYTYDWGKSNGVKGASEFILVPGANYQLKRDNPSTLMEYCSEGNDS